MTTSTTRLLPSRRARLLDWLRRSDPWHSLSLLIVLVVALVGMWPRRPDGLPSVPIPTPAPSSWWRQACRPRCSRSSHHPPSSA
jgi:hypothetical protein